MVCGSCVRNLALKLVTHHKNLDLIKALELAEKGVERVGARKIQPGIYGKDDYTQNCIGSTPGHPQYCGTQTCALLRFCRSTSECTGTCDCPEALVNSHVVTDGCVCGSCCQNYPAGACPEGCSCLCTGTCGYDCDAGYEWDGEACVSIVVVKPFFKLKGRGGDARSKVSFRSKQTMKVTP